MRPLTYAIPKPLAPINGQSILEYTLNSLPKAIDEVIIIIGHLGDRIKKKLGNRYRGIKIKYAKQEKLLGTFHALKCAKKFLSEEFLVLMGDDLYATRDLEKLLKYRRAILVKRIKDSRGRFGKCYIQNNLFKGNIEGGSKQKKNSYIYANCAAYKLTREIFKEKVIRDHRGEQLLPNMLGNLGQRKDVHVVRASFWFPIANQDDLKRAERLI